MLYRPSEGHDEYGYYRWRDQRFFDRGSAVLAAKAVGVLDPDVVFDFHDDYWATIDSTFEPEESLDELYRQRAQDLRDRFDHLILMYSGGADSHQVLTTFLRHGIRLDEVCVVVPFGVINLETASDDLAILKEYREHIVPGLQLLHYHSPQTKIRLVDMSADYTRRWTEEWLETLCLWPKPFGALFNAIWRNAETADLQRHADRLNRRVAVIYGVDKPYLQLNGNDAYLFFTDIGRDGHYAFFVAEGTPLFTPIMFFWGAPCVVLKQAHVVRRALMHRNLTVAHVLATEHRHVTLDRGIPGIDLSLIYPDWRRQRWTKVAPHNTNIITALIDRPAEQFTQMRKNQWIKLLGNKPLLTSKLHYLGRIDDNPTLPSANKTWRFPVSASGPGWKV